MWSYTHPGNHWCSFSYGILGKQNTVVKNSVVQNVKRARLIGWPFCYLYSNSVYWVISVKAYFHVNGVFMKKILLLCLILLPQILKDTRCSDKQTKEATYKKVEFLFYLDKDLKPWAQTQNAIAELTEACLDNQPKIHDKDAIEILKKYDMVDSDGVINKWVCEAVQKIERSYINFENFINSLSDTQDKNKLCEVAEALYDLHQSYHCNPHTKLNNQILQKYDLIEPDGALTEAVYIRLEEASSFYEDIIERAQDDDEAYDGYPDFVKIKEPLINIMILINNIINPKSKESAFEHARAWFDINNAYATKNLFVDNTFLQNYGLIDNNGKITQEAYIAISHLKTSMKIFDFAHVRPDRGFRF